MATYNELLYDYEAVKSVAVVTAVATSVAVASKEHKRQMILVRVCGRYSNRIHNMTTTRLQSAC